MKITVAKLGFVACLSTLSVFACGGDDAGDDADAGSGGKGGSSGANGGSSGKGGSSGSSSGGDGNAGESAGGTSGSAGTGGSTGGTSSAGMSGSSGSSGSGGTAGSMEAWCAIRSPRCVSALADCPELTACREDAACASAVGDAFDCICTGEQMGMRGEDTAGLCVETHLGAPGTLSGDIRACFGNDTPVPTECIVSIPVECNELQPVDPPIAVTSVAEAAPSPSGGTIVEGTYLLTEFVLFSSGNTEEMGALMTISVLGDTMQLVSALVGPELSRAGRSTWTFQVAGASVTIGLTCGDDDALELNEFDGFDATSTEFTLYSSSAALTFVKQ